MSTIGDKFPSRLNPSIEASLNEKVLLFYETNIFSSLDNKKGEKLFENYLRLLIPNRIENEQRKTTTEKKTQRRMIREKDINGNSSSYAQHH